MISASVGLVMTRSLPPASASRSAGRGAAEGVTRNGGAVDTAAGGEGLELGEEGGGGSFRPAVRRMTPTATPMKTTPATARVAAKNRRRRPAPPRGGSGEASGRGGRGRGCTLGTTEPWERW